MYTFLFSAKVLDKTTFSTFGPKKNYLKNIAVHETSARLGYRDASQATLVST